jgi:hypothetical protein
MTHNRGLFAWQVTRVLFAVGTFAVVTGILRCVMASSWNFAWFVLVGLALMALSTRGPWDSEKSRRQRSVMDFRVRADQDASARQRLDQ